jgi:DHA1 family bicyclomycin/chloramphenicol resistance-like MFS transporter
MASGIAVIGLFLTLLLQESRTRQSRTSQSIGAVLGQYLRLFRDRKFLGYSFAGALGNASFFAFLGSSAFVYIHHYNLTPTQYSLAFAVNAIGFIGGAQLAGKLSRRFGIERTLIGAISLCAAIATALALIVASGVDNFALLVSMLFLAYACLGPVIPSIMVLALEAQGETAGVASALAGTFQMVFGGLAVAVVGAFSDGTSFSMVVTIAACALGAAILSIATARRSLSVFHGGTRSVEADA